MHRTQATNNVSNKYKDTAPATLVVATDLNALQEELAVAVEASGATLRANGADDASDGYGQLRDAIAWLGTVLPCSLFDPSHPTNYSATFDVPSSPIGLGNFMQLQFPESTALTLANVAGGLRLGGPSGTDLNNLFRAKSDFIVPILILLNGTKEVAQLIVYYYSGQTYFDVVRMTGSFAMSDVVYVVGFPLLYQLYTKQPAP